MKAKPTGNLKDRAPCQVTGGVHAGKSGIVRDINTSKTGHVTITVVQANEERFKTLAKNVITSAGDKLPSKPKAKVTSRASKPTKPAAKAKSPPKRGAKAKAVKLLTGGNPQIAKGDGDAPVQAYLAAIPVGWTRDIGKRLDALIVRNAPSVRKAVKWNSPFYGIEGQGWFLSFHVFTRYVKVTFFRGTSLGLVPPGGTGKDARWIDIHEKDKLDEEQIATWVKQAAAMPGWNP
jgi:hypothetical protein